MEKNKLHHQHGTCHDLIFGHPFYFSGFSGFIRPGVGAMRYKTNMVASFLGFDLSDKKTDSLDDSPDAESTGVVLVPFSLVYNFASTRTQLFLGTDLTDLIRFDYVQQLGVKQENCKPTPTFDRHLGPVL